MSRLPAPSRRFLLITALALVALPLLPRTGWTWGSATHHYIAQNYSKHLPPAMDGLQAFDAIVDTHVTDPDTRKSSTPGEDVRHFIDVDTYAEFLAGALPHDRAVLEAEYGASTVENIGIVPWAVGEVVQTLTQNFVAQDWNAAALTIADLCHYVGDATQPLHCAKNYNGQLTGNTGIHSRYESTMMGSHIGDLSTPVMPITYFANPVDALFGIVSGSWDQVDDLLAADNTAKALSGGSYNTTYYNSLWSSTQAFTRTRIDSAAAATASFVYTAWVNAGQPPIPGSSAGLEPGIAAGVSLSAGPSPFHGALTVRFAGAGPLTVDVFDVRGTRVARLADVASGGMRTWRPDGALAPGLYFVRMTGPGVSVTRRVTRLQ